MNNAIIVDIDDTLSNTFHRQHFLNGEEQDFNAFYEAADKDSLNVRVYDVILSAHQMGVHVLLVTARPESSRELTETWLTKMQVPHNLLCMKEGSQYQKAVKSKADNYEKYISGKYNVLFAIDDRREIVDMWEELNVVGLLVDGPSMHDTEALKLWMSNR